jgi:GntR family transcriptional regulator
MDTSIIDRKSFIPYYIQIKQILLDRIHNGIYPFNKLLPSESKLAKEFSVTRVTIRKALDLLRQESIITSSKGVGWTVVQRRIEQQLTTSYWFGREIGNTGTAAVSQVIKAEKVGLSEDLAEIFEEKEPNLHKYYEIIRLRFFEQKPVSLEFSYIPECIAPGFINMPFEEFSIIELLKSKFDLKVGKTIEYLSPRVADGYESSVLGIQTHSPVFQTERITRDPNGSVIEFRRSIIRGDKVVFRTDFQ